MVPRHACTDLLIFYLKINLNDFWCSFVQQLRYFMYFRNPGITSTDTCKEFVPKSSSRMSDSMVKESGENDELDDPFNSTGKILSRGIIEDILATLNEQDVEDSSMTPNKSNVGSFSHLMAYRAINNEENFTPYRFQAGD